MHEKFSTLRWRLLKHRKEVIDLRETKFKEFVAKLSEVLGDKVTIILIGSRARKTAKAYSDFDLLIVYKDLKEEEIYKRVSRVKSMDLPIDILAMHLNDFNPEKNKLLREMLRSMKILYDGLALFS